MSVLGTVGSLASGLLSGVSSLVGSTISSNTAKEIAQANLDYQKEYNQQVFEREDTAYQRAVADAQAAGLSPLVAAGVSAGQSGGVASAPQYNSDEASIQMQGYQGVAQAMQQISNMSAQANLVQSQAELNEANAGKARRETADIDDQNAFRWAQLSQADKHHIDQLLDNEKGRQLQSDLKQAQIDADEVLAKMKIDADELSQLSDQEFQWKFKRLDQSDQKELLALKATYDQVLAKMESTLRQSDNEAAQKLAYNISKQEWEEGNAWLKEAPAWLNAIVNVGNLLMKFAF